MIDSAEQSPVDDELVEAVVWFIVRHGESGMIDAFLDVIFWSLEQRRAQRCGACDLSYKQHAILYFYGVTYHAFEGSDEC